MVSCSKNEQEQLSTWVSFRSAQGPLLGQFSVSANSCCAGGTRNSASSAPPNSCPWRRKPH
ncbi:hypothetical protein CJU09_07120 [Pseudomonas aeruginosa]|nr:hypothetical protein CJU09_07120 [Pseudomonas aeruginosa]